MCGAPCPHPLATSSRPTQTKIVDFGGNVAQPPARACYHRRRPAIKARSRVANSLSTANT